MYIHICIYMLYMCIYIYIYTYAQAAAEARDELGRQRPDTDTNTKTDTNHNTHTDTNMELKVFILTVMMLRKFTILFQSLKIQSKNLESQCLLNLSHIDIEGTQNLIAIFTGRQMRLNFGKKKKIL